MAAITEKARLPEHLHRFVENPTTDGAFTIDETAVAALEADARKESSKIQATVDKLDVFVVFQGKDYRPSIASLGQINTVLEKKGSDCRHIGYKACRIFFVKPMTNSADTTNLKDLAKKAEVYARALMVRCNLVSVSSEDWFEYKTQFYGDLQKNESNQYRLIISEDQQEIMCGPFIGNVKELVVLNGEEMTDEELEKIAGFTNLESLTIKHSHLRAIPESWKRLRNLKSIRLDNFPNLESGLEHIAHVPKKIFTGCPMNHSHQTLATKLRCQAEALLQDKGILAILKESGQLYFTGSYALDLMTWNDIDMQLVIQEDQSPLDTLHKILAMVARDKDYVESKIIDFSGSYKPQMPRGHYLHLKIDAPAFGGIWKLDLWILSKKDFDQSQELLKRVQDALTDKSRERILEIKHLLMKQTGRVPQMGSHWLYQAVLFHNLFEKEAILDFLRDHSVDISQSMYD